MTYVYSSYQFDRWIKNDRAGFTVQEEPYLLPADSPLLDRKTLEPERPIPECGTREAYWRHIYLKEPTDELCRIAVRETGRINEQRRAERAGAYACPDHSRHWFKTSSGVRQGTCVHCGSPNTRPNRVR